MCHWSCVLSETESNWMCRGNGLFNHRHERIMRMKTLALSDLQTVICLWHIHAETFMPNILLFVTTQASLFVISESLKNSQTLLLQMHHLIITWIDVLLTTICHYWAKTRWRGRKWDIKGSDVWIHSHLLRSVEEQPSSDHIYLYILNISHSLSQTP